MRIAAVFVVCTHEYEHHISFDDLFIESARDPDANVKPLKLNRPHFVGSSAVQAVGTKVKGFHLFRGCQELPLPLSTSEGEVVLL